MPAPFAPAASGSTLLAAIQWIETLLTGRLATTVAILAIGLVGFRLLLGQMPLRSAARVILGCFILFGAPAIARGLIGAIQGGDTISAPGTEAQYEGLPPPPPAPQAPAGQNGNPFDPNPTVPQ